MSVWVIGGLIFGAWAVLSVVGYERERQAADAEALREMLAAAEANGAQQADAASDEETIVVS